MSDNGATPFTIEVWSDLVCPWCYLGRARLRRAIEEIGDGETKIAWRSFQLDPGAPRFGEPGAGRPLGEHLAEKYGEGIGAMQERLAELMAAEGLPYAPERAHAVNSFEALRLVKVAEREGRAEDVVGRLFARHHAEGGRIDDPTTLAEIGEAAGLSPETVAAAPDDEAAAAAIGAEIATAARLEVRGVPFFVFAGQLAVSGAQASDVLVAAISQARG